MNKIKVAEVITRMDWGGSPDIVRIICCYLNPDLYDITLVTGSTKSPSTKTKEFFEKFSPKIVVIPELKRNINPISDLAALIRLYLLFRRQNFDIVHTHTAKAGVLGRIAARFANVPNIIHTPHGHNFYGYFGPMKNKIIVILERLVACFTDKIMALTELEKADLITFKVSQPKKIVVINSGLQLDKFRKVDIDIIKKREELLVKSDEILIGMVGRLEPVKGPEYLIEAAKLVIKKFPKVKFLIVGEGTLRNKLESRCKNLGISDKFIFTGWREDITEILAVLDILVLPSLNEAVGRILIEAGACGVPVVATNVGGVPEIVKGGQTGILVPPKDPHSLSQAVISLLEDKEKRQRMGEAARSWVDDKFSAEIMVNKVSNLYQELMRSEKI